MLRGGGNPGIYQWMLRGGGGSRDLPVDVKRLRGSVGSCQWTLTLEALRGLKLTPPRILFCLKFLLFDRLSKALAHR